MENESSIFGSENQDQILDRRANNEPNKTDENLNHKDLDDSYHYKSSDKDECNSTNPIFKPNDSLSLESTNNNSFITAANNDPDKKSNKVRSKCSVNRKSESLNLNLNLDPNEKCPHCDRSLGTLNDYNRKIHKESCQLKKLKAETKKNKKLTKATCGLPNKKRIRMNNLNDSKKVKTYDSEKLHDQNQINTLDVSTKESSSKILEAKNTPDQPDNSSKRRSLRKSAGKISYRELSDYAKRDFILPPDTDGEEDIIVQPVKNDVASCNHIKCKGYKPPINYQPDTLYSNFPFQALDLDREHIKFTIENGTFHSLNCCKNEYQIEPGSKDGINRSCYELVSNKYLQNVFKRSQIASNFSSMPHVYLTYNQLKKELNQYRENIKKLKLENLNMKRTLIASKKKEAKYQQLIDVLGQNDYGKVSQIVNVCINQNRGINGIIERLVDLRDGVYCPREKDFQVKVLEEVGCKICNEKVGISKMRNHVAKHIQNKEVEEAGNRCGFCGLTTNNCTIGIRVAYKKTNNIVCQSYWPLSNCVYFRNFNLKLTQKKEGLFLPNKPVKCIICNLVVWSYNMRAHYIHFHPDHPFPSEFEMAQAEQSNLAEKNEEVRCKICNEKFSLSKMRDHVAKHIIINENEIIEGEGDESLRCGFCGIIGDCTIDIKITSGSGKSTTYGPVSNCPYYRRFNLKSSTRPTKTSPTTNRPIECHICNKVYWSYNMMVHFVSNHPNEKTPNLITEQERELVLKF